MAKRVNQSYIDKILGKHLYPELEEQKRLQQKKLLKEQQDKIQKFLYIENFYSTQKSKNNEFHTNLLLPLNNILPKLHNKLLSEQDSSQINSSWVMQSTPQGIFFINKDTGQWMNNLGVVANTLDELLHATGEDLDGGSSSRSSITPSPDDPLPPAATSVADYEVWATTFEEIPSWNTPQYTTISVVPTIFIVGNNYNGYRAFNDTNLTQWTTSLRNNFITLAQSIPESRRVALVYYFFDELVPYTENKRATYAATTDGITYGNRRFLTPWLNDSFTLYKSLFTSVLQYLDSNNITIPYFNDDKESIEPSMGLMGFVSNYYHSGSPPFDVNGNPTAPWTSYPNYSPPGGSYLADARTPAAIMSDSRFTTFVNPLTTQTFAQSVVDLYKGLSNNPGYTGTAFDLYSLAAGITHPGDFTCYYCYQDKQFSFFGPGKSLTEVQRQDNLLKLYAWNSTMRELIQGYYVTRAHTESFAAVSRFNNSIYSNYEDFPINVEESQYYQDSNNQRLLKRDYSNLSGGMVFYGNQGNILGLNYTTANNLRAGYVQNPQTNAERFNFQGYNDPSYTPSSGSTLVRYASNLGNYSDYNAWLYKIAYLQLVMDIKHLRLSHRSKTDYWKYHTPWLWLNNVFGSAYNSNSYGYRYYNELIYHIACHGVLYFIRYSNGVDVLAERQIMHNALEEWRNISYNSKARPCSNATGDINSLVDRIVLADAFDKVLISGGKLLVTGKYLWRITVPPSAVRPDNTVVLQRVGSDSDIPATITINAPTSAFDYTNAHKGLGAWVKRIVNTPPQYVVVPP